MKIYLVEAWSPRVEFDEDSLIVALTPLACCQLDKSGIEYSIIEDYYYEVELAALEDEYHQSQLGWIQGLDEFLQDNVKELKELNLRLGSIYYYYLKTMVLDPLYIRCYTLSKLFETKPSSAVFISSPPKEKQLEFTLKNQSGSFYSEAVPILCRENNVKLIQVFVEPVKKSPKETKCANDVIKSRLARTVGKLKIVRMLYYAYKGFGQRPLLAKRPDENGLKILVLHRGYGAEGLIKDALRKGYNIYQLSGDFILKYTSHGAKWHLDLKTEYKDKITGLDTNVWQSTAKLLEGNDIIKWVNEKCQADVSDIVLPRLKYFVSNACPETLAYYRVFTELYEDDKIDFVFTPIEVSLTQFAAIAAANHHRHTRSASVFHGGDIFANKLWDITELSHFDIYLTSNKELREYLRHRCDVNNFPTAIYNSSYGWSNVKRIAYLREKRKGGVKKRIIYLPTALMGDTRRLDCATYPDTWYYHLQKSLIEYFSKKGEYTFVWKGLPTADAVYNPIPNFIKDSHFSNIEIATNPFIEHLLSADRIICDYPSTGFYESVVAGVPIMSLYHKSFKVRKSAIDYFGNLLKSYSDIPEAIKHIDEFLNSDPELYKINIEMGDERILHILEKVGRKTE